MEGPRNCYECTHGKEQKVCPACGATGGLAGKVWPSVEGESVQENVLGGYVDFPNDGRVFIVGPMKAGTRVRIIVQPLKEGE
jgi:hypothetical protein